MTKRLSAVVGEYTKDGQQKAEWANIGVIGTGKNGKEYVLLDPTVNLAGVLLKQNVLAQKRNEAPSDMVMTSVFDDSQQQGQGNQGGYQQQVQPHPNQSGGVPPQGTQGYGASGPQAPQQGGLVDDGSGIPF